MGVGIAAILTGRTADIITLSVFGALTLYVISMLALLRLRRTRPEMNRPYRTPAYPFFPLAALGIALVCLCSMAFFNPKMAAIYLGLVALAYGWFYFGVSSQAKDAVRRHS